MTVVSTDGLGADGALIIILTQCPFRVSNFALRFLTQNVCLSRVPQFYHDKRLPHEATIMMIPQLCRHNEAAIFRMPQLLMNIEDSSMRLPQ